MNDCGWCVVSNGNERNATHRVHTMSVETGSMNLNSLLAARVDAAAAGGTPARLTILLIDDDEDCRELIREAIHSSCRDEHQIIEFGDGQAAIDHLAAPGAAAPTLIFLDVEMPRLNGLDTLAAIKHMPSMASVPIVMLTGVADEAYIRRAAALGANSYTVKPAGAEQFLHTVQASATYWLTIHACPTRHLPQSAARR